MVDKSGSLCSWIYSVSFNFLIIFPRISLHAALTVILMIVDLTVLRDKSRRYTPSVNALCLVFPLDFRTLRLKWRNSTSRFDLPEPGYKNDLHYNNSHEHRFNS